MMKCFPSLIEFVSYCLIEVGDSVFPISLLGTKVSGVMLHVFVCPCPSLDWNGALKEVNN
jgi:hypothetical protein